MQSHLLIGAASSGSGKTTFTLGLLRALKNRSFEVQPFKCGPDYIDTRHHRMAAGNPSVNLDLFMMSEAHVHAHTRFPFCLNADIRPQAAAVFPLLLETADNKNPGFFF